MESSLASGPRVCFKVEKVIGVSSEGNIRTYQVQWAPAWVSSFHLVGCEHLIQEFLCGQQQRQKQQQAIMSSNDMMEKDIQLLDLPAISGEPASTTSHLDNISVPEPFVLGDASQHSENIRIDKQSGSAFETGDMQFIFNKHPVSIDSVDSNGSAGRECDIIPSKEMHLDQTTIKVEDENTKMEGDEYQLSSPSSWNRNLNITSPPDLTYAHKSRRSPNQQLESYQWYGVNDGSEGNTANPVREISTTTAGKSRDHSCMVCGREFTCRSNLEVHLRLHRGDKPFKCPHCEKAFTQSGNFNRHLRIHSGVKPFNCPRCDASFAKKTSLKNHIAMHDWDVSHSTGD